MTQPPGQPPTGGGFGAPQDPQSPQGGFGPPQDPRQAVPPPPAQPPVPPQPGYGPPQQSGPYAQAPQQSGPYAQPPQPGPYGQPGYGYPQQSGPYARPQPGYGYPQQPHQFPGAPTPPPGGGSKNPFKGRPALAVGAAIAVLLVIGGTVYAVSGDGDGGKKPTAGGSPKATPSTGASAPVNPGDGSGDGGADPENLNEGRKAGESKVLWYKEAPDAPGSGADAPGMWITAKSAVKAAYKQVFAYNVADGAPSWDPISFPQKICAVTPRKTADDKIVVAYMSGISSNAKCNRLQEIDLGTGKKGWSAEVADGALFDSTLSLELTVTGKTLMVGRSQSGTAYDVGTGKKLWDKQRYGAACFPSAFAGGTKLISVASCGAGGPNEHDEVQELDPATGKARWTRPIPKGWTVSRAFSVDPVVLYLTNDDKKSAAISTLKNDGTPRSDVHSKESFAPQCGWAVLERDLQGCTGVVADADTLYLPTEAKTGPNEIVAVNLDTGKEKWRVKSPGDESMLPLKSDGTRLIAYVQPSYSAGGQVVSLPTTGGSHTVTGLLRNPSGAAPVEGGFYAKAIDYVAGRFYVSSTRLSGGNQSKEKLMLAYGK
ncbi:PQQ-binding-like beta-propeller repeat protein [Streptomyces sp. NPDC047009]|uniref:outer membrane protein assembly factor BamB family protein n=1 Tax=unclassified Streptomyces TaxID=2593676 RepID=UPI0033F8759D